MDIVIASDPEREDLFAEVHDDGQPCAEVIWDQGRRTYLVTLFVGDSPDAWPVVALKELQRALSKAKQALMDRGSPRED